MGSQAKPDAPPVVALSLAGSLASASVAACWAECCTLPIDTVKVRMQINPGLYGGLGSGLVTMARTEGVRTLWSGLDAGLMRQVVFGTLRLGLYEPVRNALHGADSAEAPGLLVKIQAGLFSGCMAMLVAQPTDVVKVRLQAQGLKALQNTGGPVEIRYTSAVQCLSKIAAEEGLAGLYTGLGPNLARNCVINAAELASYDQIKQTVLTNNLLSDAPHTHMICAFGAGFVACCVGSPVDVVKTRVMNKPLKADGTPLYSSAADCALKIVRNEGAASFYAGFIPNFMRIGCWNCVMFVTLEKIRANWR
jgi:solute carrier family 25 uncoupling protein 8/9